MKSKIERGGNDREKSEKEKFWDETAARIGKTIDKLGMRVDSGIKDMAVALNVCGIHTTASCEGHLDRDEAGPWVDVEAKDAVVLRTMLGNIKKQRRSRKYS